jgi:hypothetical protein
MEWIASLLGIICRKTIHRHYEIVYAYSEITVLRLAEYLAINAPFISRPEQQPYNNLFT